jgi:hypothetical protein
MVGTRFEVGKPAATLAGVVARCRVLAASETPLLPCSVVSKVTGGRSSGAGIGEAR